VKRKQKISPIDPKHEEDLLMLAVEQFVESFGVYAAKCPRLCAEIMKDATLHTMKIFLQKEIDAAHPVRKGKARPYRLSKSKP